MNRLEALVTWNYLTEPGDRVAGALISALGPELALEKFLSADHGELQELTEVELCDAYERWRPRFRKEQARELLNLAKRFEIGFVERASNLWPSGLAKLGRHEPQLLWFRGNRNHFENLDRSVAVVGSRIVTGYGAKVGSELVEACVSERASVISGGALGVDAVAHRSALASGGLTIAYMAGGIDCVYPSAHLQLFDEIANRGLLISELPPGTRPTRWRFLQRNRLIAASSQAVVVIEAGLRSGSLNTASHANDIGIPVFAIPGPITSPNSAGCNALIREGKAQILSSIADLGEDLGWNTRHGAFEIGMGQLELRLYDALDFRTKSSSDLAALAGLTMNEFRIAASSLELSGMAKRNGVGWVKQK